MPLSLALVVALLGAAPGRLAADVPAAPRPVESGVPAGNPTTLLWYAHPAEKWDDALPVGNGRLGAMVFGKTDEEEIPINESTCWSGGPYSTTVRGGYRALPEIQRLIFDGQLVRAHKAFGRHLLGYPVEQQKYQALGSVSLRFPGGGEVRGYRHQLDLDAAIVTTRYEQGGTTYTREAFVSPVDQVILVRFAADRPGRIALRAQLRGARNQAHSNYATDYFHMDGLGTDGLVVRGKSADYLGVTGALRFVSRLKALPDPGRSRGRGARSGRSARRRAIPGTSRPSRPACPRRTASTWVSPSTTHATSAAPPTATWTRPSSPTSWT
jgi:alpha-L-fucosidase 2